MALPGTTLFSDTFTRADGGLGANWDDGYTTHTSLAIVGNVVRGTLLANGGNLETINTALPGDQWGLVQLVTLPDIASTIQSAQIALRYADPPSEAQGYVFVIADPTSLPFNSAIIEDGGGTTLVSENVVVWGSGDWLLATAQSTTLTLYRLASGGDPDVDSFTLVLQTTHGTFTSGRGGIKIYVDSDLSHVELDNVRFGKFGFDDDSVLWLPQGRTSGSGRNSIIPSGMQN
jgi:hypothetical protein